MKGTHWQYEDYGFYCDLDPQKSFQSPAHECRFCRQAERDELAQLKLKLIEQEKHIDYLEDKLAMMMIRQGILDLKDAEPF